MSAVTDPYPHTLDCPPEEGGDTALALMRGGMARVEFRHAQGEYLAQNGGTCALGGIAAADGQTTGKLDRIADNLERMGILNGAPYDEWQLLIEPMLSDAAREAIALLDAVALERHPEYVAEPENADSGNWEGPLEWVNEEWVPEAWLAEVYRRPRRARVLKATRKAEVLAIYAETIRRRAAAVSPMPERVAVAA